MIMNADEIFLQQLDERYGPLLQSGATATIPLGAKML